MVSIRYIVLVLIICLARAPWAPAGESVTWMTVHWPPIMELDADSRQISGGQYGNMLKMVSRRLGGYEHITREMTWNRFWYFVKKGEKLCNCMAYKNKERETFAEFSIPISLILPNHIVMRKDTFERLGSPATLSLIDVMRDSQLKGLLIQTRSYSSDIDRILDIYEAQSNITRSIINEQTYIKILAMKRADYILEYPFVIRTTVDRYLPEFKDLFAYVPVTEIADFYYVYIACPKTQWGREFIKEVNAVLNELRPLEDFRRELENIYSGEQLERVRVYYNRHLLSVTK